jgi:hypothetical protein
MRIRAGLTNTGASIVRLKDDVKVVYVYGAAITDAAPGMLPDWGEHLLVAPVFSAHKWIEAQETVSDETLATVPDHDWLAYRVELIVASKKKKRWSANAVVPATDLEQWRRHVTPGVGTSGPAPGVGRRGRADARRGDEDPPGS